ncbi:MAG TPA: NnrU family protein [Rhizomicrobium sp.]|nr:NnrU family protein [Rhizomicrobium sp.]
MVMLLSAAALFLAIHLLVAGTRLRDAITGTIGEGPYLGLFSLASIGGIVWLALSYNAASIGSDNRVLFDLGRGVHDLAIPAVLIAFLIGVPGLMMPNPTSVRQEDVALKENAVRGVLRITRHPFLWGVALWSAVHLAANGDLASVVLFGTFLVLSVLGTFSIDAKRKRKLGAQWEGFAARTSNVPFGAIVSGRETFVAREYFDWRFAAALAIFAIVLFGHARVIGASPFPNGWIPF